METMIIIMEHFGDTIFVSCILTNLKQLCLITKNMTFLCLLDQLETQEFLAVIFVLVLSDFCTV